MPHPPCRDSRSTLVDTPCACSAPAPAAPRSCCSPGVARCPQTWVGSRPGSPPTPASASTTVRVAGGAERSAPAGTLPRSPPTCTPCCTVESVPGPYVLAGHSFGGLYVLTYAARYPDQVAGMVLVDTTAPARDTACPRLPRFEQLLPPGAGRHPALHLGSTRPDPPIRAGRSRHSAAAVRRRGPGHPHHRQQPAQFPRRVRPNRRVRGRSGRVHRLRRQAVGGAHRRNRQRRRPDRQP